MRNDRIFNKVCGSTAKVADDVFSVVYEWVRYRVNDGKKMEGSHKTVDEAESRSKEPDSVPIVDVEEEEEEVAENKGGKWVKNTKPTGSNPKPTVSNPTHQSVGSTHKTEKPSSEPKKPNPPRNRVHWVQKPRNRLWRVGFGFRSKPTQTDPCSALLNTSNTF
ncbi:hypothetical protein LXL04_033062 [Taraxacum kok-saghyz]